MLTFFRNRAALVVIVLLVVVGLVMGLASLAIGS
jgi:hypothetical protein